MKDFQEVWIMAAFGDHPPLPKALEQILDDETTSTVFLKADCPHVQKEDTSANSSLKP